MNIRQGHNSIQISEYSKGEATKQSCKVLMNNSCIKSC